MYENLKETKKIMLSYDEQIVHLEKKGITHKKWSKDEVKKYLQCNNNFFRLLAYRENFQKDSISGKYLQLDFSYLEDLASIDMKLRKIILCMSLDIEHYSKLKLLDLVMQKYENKYGNQIVEDYRSSLKKEEDNKLRKEIERNSGGTYIRGLCDRYELQKESRDFDFPIWAFLEVITFGRFIDFYKFCVNEKMFKNNDKEHKQYKNTFFLLRTVKEARNAAAHNNCFINDLRANNSYQCKSQELTNALAKIKISHDQRVAKLSNKRIEQIVTCLYTHKKIVTSNAVYQNTCDELQKFSKRIFEKFDYGFNPAVQTTFQMINKIIDSWYSVQ